MADKHSPRSVEEIADQLAEHMLANNEGDISKRALTTLLEEAITACFGDKKTFFEQVLQHLSQKELEKLFALLQQKMQLAGADMQLLNAIREALKRAGVSAATAADISRGVSASTGGKLPPSYRRGTRR